MRFRFFIDPKTGEPHIYEHGVTEREVEQVFEDDPYKTVAREGAYQVSGQTWGGRYLRIVYREEGPDEVFVIHARDLRKREKRTYRKKMGRL